MIKYWQVLKNTKLFNDISSTEFEVIIDSLKPSIKIYQKGDYIVSIDDKIKCLGIIISGSINIIKIDIYGNEKIITYFSEGHMFAETLALLNKPSFYNIIASSECVIIYFDINYLLSFNTLNYEINSKITKNLILVLANKNYILNQKIEVTSSKTIRDRVLAYLEQQSKINNNHIFKIPFNREQLASYLNVDRSALSNELSKLSNEGIISFKKDIFTIKKR